MDTQQIHLLVPDIQLDSGSVPILLGKRLLDRCSVTISKPTLRSRPANRTKLPSTSEPELDLMWTLFQQTASAADTTELSVWFCWGRCLHRLQPLLWCQYGDGQGSGHWRQLVLKKQVWTSSTGSLYLLDLMWSSSLKWDFTST